MFTRYWPTNSLTQCFKIEWLVNRRSMSRIKLFSIQDWMDTVEKVAGKRKYK